MPSTIPLARISPQDYPGAPPDTPGDFIRRGLFDQPEGQLVGTTAAMALGAVPHIAAHGTGAASRFNMGLVIGSVLSIGTVFTLFVLPSVYRAIAARYGAPKVANDITVLAPMGSHP